MTVVGYYVHHVGRGHLHRAQALAGRLTAGGVRVVGLSTLRRPEGWVDEWVRLPADDDAAPRRVDGNGHLHWAPLRHDGTCARAAAISAWLGAAGPRLVVVDVSVEVSLLVRLHGIPVVGVVLPGRRDDGPHVTGLGVAEALVGFWPAGARLADGLPADLRGRLHPVGGLSRHPVSSEARPPRRGRQRVALMLGAGGHTVRAGQVAEARSATPGWEWQLLGTDAATWVEDPSGVLAGADVVVTHAGQNAVAETAGARRPAVVLPQPRPHDEQRAMGAELRRGWPAVVRDDWPHAADWPVLLERAAGLDTARWEQWCDGAAADRFAEVVLGVAQDVVGAGAR